MTIVAAAIIGHDGRAYSCARPARHHDVIAQMVACGHPRPVTGEQGFMDDERGFVDRAEAARIALGCGQVSALGWPPRLYSEDLW